MTTKQKFFTVWVFFVTNFKRLFRDGTPVLACPALFGHFPVALLERQGPRA